MTAIACCCRASTDEQSPDRQLTSTSEYAEREFGADVGGFRIYRDKSTGTNTDRSGYQDMMADAQAGEFRAVVVAGVSRICRSISELERTATRLEDAGVTLHVVSEGLTLEPDETDPYQTALFRLLGVFAELEADMAQRRTREGTAARTESDDYHHGPAPFGSTKDDGELIEADDSHDVVAVLETIEKAELPKGRGTERLDTSRATISRASGGPPELSGL